MAIKLVFEESRALDSPVARSLTHSAARTPRLLDRLLDHAIVGSLDRGITYLSIIRSLDRMIARSIARSFVQSRNRSLDRSIAPLFYSLYRLLARSFDRLIT